MSLDTRTQPTHPVDPVITNELLAEAFEAAGLATSDTPATITLPLERRRGAWRAELALPRRRDGWRAHRRRAFIAGFLGAAPADVAIDTTDDPPGRHVLIYLFDPQPTQNPAQDVTQEPAEEPTP